MIVNYSINPNQKLTQSQREEIRKELEHAKTLEPQFDDDCPRLSEAMLKSLGAAVRNRNRAMNMRKA